MNQADLAMCILRKIEIIRVGPHMVEFRRKVSGYDDLPFAFIIGGQITEHRTIGPAGKYIMQSLEAALNLLHPDSGLESFINAASRSKRDCNGVEVWLQSAVIMGGGETTPAKHPKLHLVPVSVLVNWPVESRS